MMKFLKPIGCIQCYRENHYYVGFSRPTLTCKFCGIEIPIPKERKK